MMINSGYLFFRNFVTVCCLVTVSCLVPAAVLADAYPSRPIRLIVPFPPGPGTDAIARIVAPQLTEALGRQVIVDNRAGANGIIGMEVVAKAAPDGYMLGMATPGPNAAGRALFPTLSFDPQKDFSPIILLNKSPDVLLVHPSVPAKSVKELVKLAKANPGKLNAAIAAVGSMNHFVNEWFKQEARIDFMNVPYKGGAPALADAVGGQVDILFIGVTSALGFVESGRLRALAVSNEARVPQMASVPTMREVGYPKVIGSQWNGIVAPAGTPKDIVDRLNAETAKALASRETQERFSRIGTVAVGGSPDSFAAFLRRESERLGNIIRVASIRAE